MNNKTTRKVKNSKDVKTIKSNEPLKYVAMNLRVPLEFRREVKTYASAHDLSIIEVMTKAFEYYKKHKR